MPRINIAAWVREHVSKEIRDYHSRVMLGLIPERSYSSWGPADDDERCAIEIRDQTKVRMMFRKIDWNGGTNSWAENDLSPRFQNPKPLKRVRGANVSKRHGKKRGGKSKKGHAKVKEVSRRLSSGGRAWR